MLSTPVIVLLTIASCFTVSQLNFEFVAQDAILANQNQPIKIIHFWRRFLVWSFSVHDSGEGLTFFR